MLPLFRLPYLVLINVITSFSLAELTTLTFCSKNCRNLLFRLRKLGKMTVQLELTIYGVVSLKWQNPKTSYREYFEISIQKSSKLCKTNCETIKIGDSVVPMIVSGRSDREKETRREIYIDNVFEGIKIVSEYLCEFFSLERIEDLGVTAHISPDYPRKMIDWIIGRQKTYRHLFMNCLKISEPEISYILSMAKYAKQIYLEISPGQSYEHQFEFGGDHIEVKNGYWFRLSNLCHVNSRFLAVDGSKLTCNDLNVFLKHWISGGSRRIQTVDIQIEVDNLGVVFDGIEVNVREWDVIRTYKSCNDNEIAVRGGIDITRQDDGQIATIVHPLFINSNAFYFIVWDQIAF